MHKNTEATVYLRTRSLSPVFLSFNHIVYLYIEKECRTKQHKIEEKNDAAKEKQKFNK